MYKSRKTTNNNIIICSFLISNSRGVDKMYNFRTDLATERRDLYQKANNIEKEIDGIESQKEDIDENLKIERVKITNENGQKAIGKPIGDYITIDIKKLKIAQAEEINKAGEVVSNELKTGELLPSIRSLAKDLRISVITTKSAYEELEREGYVETIPGKGTYVANKNIELIREEQIQKIESLIDTAVEIAKISGITKQEMEEILDILYKEGK